MRDLIFACCWVILFPAAFLSAHIGVLLWIWVSLSTPNLMLYNFLSSFPFNKVIAIITLALVVFKKEKKDFYFDSIILIFFIFLIIGNISNFLTESYFSENGYIYEKIMKESALFLVITGVMYSRHRLHVAIVAFCIALAVVGAFEGAAYVASGMGHKVLGSGALGDNNGVAVAMLMAIPLCFYVYSYSEEKIMRVGFAILIFLSVITVVATFSRGGFLGLLVLAVFMIMNTRNKALPIGLIILSGALLLFLAPPEWFERVNSIKDADSNLSFLGRVVAWKVATVAALDRPFYGAGFHALQDYDIWNKYIPRISSVDFFPTPDLPTYAVAAHSIFFEVLGDTGFAGLFCFVSIIGMCIFNCGKIAKRCKGQPDLLWANDMARLLRVSVIVYTAAGAALSFAYFEGFWIVVALISRLNHTTIELTRPRSRAELAMETTEREEAKMRELASEI